MQFCGCYKKQTNKKTHEIPGSKTKDFIIIARGMSNCTFSSVLLAPRLRGYDPAGPRRKPVHHWLHFRTESLSLGTMGTVQDPKEGEALLIVDTMSLWTKVLHIFFWYGSFFSGITH